MTQRERKGFTLVELLIAVVLFATAMLIGGRSILEFVRQVSVSEVRELAAEFAMEELERVKLLPYEQINSVPATPVPEAPEYIRTVAVAVFGTDPAALYGYRLITVTVQPPAELEAVRLSTAVAEPGPG